MNYINKIRAMKQYLKSIMAMVALMLATTIAWGENNVSVVTLQNGTISSTAGTVTAVVSDGVCTLTVTPAVGNYLTADNLVAVKTIDGGMAQARSNVPGVDSTPIEVAAADATADPSGVTVYTLTMPSEEYGVEVTADFQARINIAGAVITLSDNVFFHDGNAKEPAVTSVVLGETALTEADYSVSYENNVEAGEATVRVTGLRTYTGEATTTFTIGELSSVLFTVGATTDVYADKTVTILAPDTLEGDRIFYSYYNYDTKEASNDTVYSAPFALTKVGKYIVKARVRRGDKAGVEYSTFVYVLKQPRFNPEEGKYDRERQVKIINLPTLPTGDEDYPQVWYQKVSGGTTSDYKRYFNGDTITVSTTTTVNAYVQDMSSDGKELKSDVFSSTYTFQTIEDYHLTVAGVQVNTLNKENVMGDDSKSVRYDAESNVLTLNGANIGDGSIANGIETSLESLTVHLVGVNTLTSSTYGIYSAGTGTITFTTPAETPGKLHFVGPADGNDIHGLTANYGILQLSNHWITVRPTSYGLTVDGTEVNSANYDDVLGNGRVWYSQQSQTLVLDSAQITVVSSSLDSLRVHLLKNSTIANATAEPLQSTKAAKLRFTTSPNAPGTLILKSNTGKWISDNFTIAPFEYSLKMDTLSTDSIRIARSIPITPIVEDDGSDTMPEGDVTFDSGDFTDGDEDVDLSNVVINSVLYTLSDGAGNFDEGDETFDNPSGIVLKEQMSEEDVDDAQAETPGTDDYADKFKGLTLMVPAGIGQIYIVAETGGNAVLNVRIGNREPYSISHVEFSDTTRIPFELAEATLVYIYLSDSQAESAARGVGPHRERVQTGHVKISNLGSSNTVMVNTNSAQDVSTGICDQVKVFDMPLSAFTPDGAGIVMSTIEVDAPAGAAPSRSRRAEASNKVMMPITELSTTVFSSVDKSNILYVDLAGTQIADLTVNRDGGVMDGFGDNTLIYLPTGNSDGGEPNVIINDTCSQMKLYDTHDFLAPRTFFAQSADVNREFEPGMSETLFLPFSIPADQMAGFGAFHSFNTTDEDRILFDEADETKDLNAAEPYLFVPAVDAVVAANVEVKKTETASATSNGFVGTYKYLQWENAPSDVFVLAAGDENNASGRFVKAEAGAEVRAFHAYLKVASSSVSDYRVVIGEDDTTGISLSQETVKADAWYTIDGQRLTGRPSLPGLYIQNNHKIIVR